MFVCFCYLGVHISPLARRPYTVDIDSHTMIKNWSMLPFHTVFGMVLYRIMHDISVVSIIWLYDTYCIIHFIYTILQTIYFA